MNTQLLLQDKTLSLEMRGVNNYSTELNDSDLNQGVHRDLVGGLWDEIGNLQYRFLRDHGLQPNMNLLDIGCGCLRGGLHFIRYLDPGRYHGVDINASLLRAGMLELRRAHLLDRGATLLQSADFNFRALDKKFNVAIAISVFTHLFFNHIARCLHGIKQVLTDSGVFYATFFNAPTCMHIHSITHDPGSITTQYDSDPFHCHPSELAMLAQCAGLQAEFLGEWAHPRAQQMIAFRHA